MTTLEELEKLLKAGTPGPWNTVGDKSPNMTGVHAGHHTRDDSYLLFTCINDPNDDGPMGEGGLLPETVAQWKADAALIVAAINALPGLLESARRVRELEARNKELKHALQSAAAWVKHWQADGDCNLKPTPGSLTDAATEIAVALKETQ